MRLTGFDAPCMHTMYADKPMHGHGLMQAIARVNRVLTSSLPPLVIQAPSACIDYVITHEICHLKHPDHGPKFRALLQQLCPGWKKLKERLERAV